eukprot:9472464-Pyramimonas_sp.AAC.1
MKYFTLVCLTAGARPLHRRNGNDVDATGIISRCEIFCASRTVTMRSAVCRNSLHAPQLTHPYTDTQSHITRLSCCSVSDTS